MDIGTQHFDLSFIITTGLSIISILVAIFTYFGSRRRRRLSYKIVSVKPAPIYEGTQPGQTLHVVEMCYRNAGNVALTEDMFRSNIVTEFLDNAEIIQAKSYLTMYSLYANVQFNGSTALIEPVLMNKDDTIYVSYRVANFKYKIHVGARIVDGQEIVNFAVRDSLYQWFSVFAMLFIGLLAITVKNNAYSEFSSQLRLIAILSTPLFIMMIFRILKLIREQCRFYFAFEVRGSRDHLSGGL